MTTCKCKCGAVIPNEERLQVHIGVCPVLLWEKIAELEAENAKLKEANGFMERQLDKWVELEKSDE